MNALAKCLHNDVCMHLFNLNFADISILHGGQIDFGH